MSVPPDRRQRWFSVITLILCIGILMGLLLPAVNTHPRGSLRTHCANNIKNLALATINFETSKKQYPGFQASFGRNTDGRAKIGSWAVALLPMLEQQALRDEWDDPATYDAWATAIKNNDDRVLQSFYPKISVLICPSDLTKSANYAPSSYAANAGFQLLPNDPALGMESYANAADASEQSTISQRAANGIFANRLGPNVLDPQTGETTKVFGYHSKPIRSDDVREDGLSNTIVFAENCNSLSWQDFSIADDSSRCKLGVVWLYAGKSVSEGRPKPMVVTDAMRINKDNKKTGTGPLRARPTGMHPGVVVVAMADGSTRSISEEIDYHVYQSLMAPHDAKSDLPNLDYVLKEDDYLR